ncbi:hypothetical protein DYB32_000786 [Aphanomyces invadans]|uniref:Mediator complex subunit Med12 LCEWAV-domain domain-containing protein n=1 Tax=Aphanomyces invadans TaxID=157072 RepID=A0A418B8W1_9STRA|nr:hypothetical protein DYB32_000786 [Aphanomyces invadans]
MLTARLALVPGVFPTHNDNDEEKYHFFAKRRATYVATLPRGLGPMPSSWHRQYALFPDTPPLFDRLGPLLLESSAAAAAAPRKKKGLSTDSFLDYLVRQVRRFDPATSHLWMTELAKGHVSIPALVQSFGGIPFEQWRASPEAKCPLLDVVAKYKIGMLEASWFIRINVIYQELNEMRRDRDRRVGDWFFHPKRFQRRAFEWTEQLLCCLHRTARQCFAQRIRGTRVKKKIPGAIKRVRASWTESTAAIADDAKPHAIATSSDDTFRYFVQLAEYHFELGLLDRSRFFTGILSLYQKSLLLSEKSPIQDGMFWSVLPMPVNQLFLVLGLLIKLLPDMLRDSSATKLLVKITLAHFQVVVPPRDDVAMGCPHHERLVVALCDILRRVLHLGADHLVQVKDDGTSARSFPVAELVQLQRTFAHVWARKARLAEKEAANDKAFAFVPVDKRLRNEVDVIEILDEFHGGNSTVEVADIYKLIFEDKGAAAAATSVDAHAIVTICEWAVTIHRAQEFKYITAAYLFEMRNDAILEHSMHEAALQDTLVWFLKTYEPQHAVEMTAVIDLFSLLIRRRLFVFEAFVESVANVCRSTQAAPKSPTGDAKALRPSSVLCQAKFQFEFGPTKGGFHIDRLRDLSQTDRLRLYLWQLPRGDNPLTRELAMELAIDNDEYVRSTWMELVYVIRSDIKRSRALERVMILSHQVFQLSNVGAPPDGAASAHDVVVAELDQMTKIFELCSLVKKLSGHDKGRFAVWLVRHVYEIPTDFFVLNELNTVEHVLRMTCVLLELTDVLSLLQLLIHFLRHAPVYVVKSVVLPIVDRHHGTFYACHDILSLIQAFEYRCSAFRAAGLDPDDASQTIALFICRIYQRHSKALDKALQALHLHSPPEVLTKAFFTLLKDDSKAAKDAKDVVCLEGVNQKFAFPKDKDAMPADLHDVMTNVFAALQRPTKTAAPAAFTTIMGTIDKHDMTCRDQGVDDAVHAILTFGPLTSQQRIFIFRVVLTEVMDKWVSLLHTATSRITNGGGAAHQQSIYVLVPQYMHRCVYVLRDVIDGHDESERKLMRDTLLTWLHKEVIVAFNGAEPTPKGQVDKPKTKNVFVKHSATDSSGKDAFAANLKGHLDKVQYGLKLFLMTLVVHGIVDLTQVLRFVLVPGFPKKNASAAAAPRAENRTLSNQILSMTLAFHLLGDAPPQFAKLGHNVFANFEDPLDYWRYLRSMVPCTVMFPFVFLLCQMSYYWSAESNALQPRQERGVLASTLLFDCTNDVVVREIIFADKSVKDRHVLKDNGDAWFMAVLLKLLWRPLNSPAELSTNRIDLLRADEIFAGITKWSLHRGGAIYLEVEVKRKHIKVTKRAKGPPSAVVEAAPPPAKVPEVVAGDAAAAYYQARLDTMPPPSAAPHKLDDKASASDKIGALIVHRLFAPCVRPVFVAPPSSDAVVNSAIESQLAAREAADAAVANLYASTLCSIYTGHGTPAHSTAASYVIATSIITAAVARALEALEADAQTTTDDQYLHTFNGSIVAVFLRRVLSSHGSPNNLFLRYMRSTKGQLEALLHSSQSADAATPSTAYVAALRRKIALRLQLVSITASMSASPCPHRNGIVKLLFSMLGTAVVADSATLFEWILDLIPVIPSTVFADRHCEVRPAVPPSCPDGVFRTLSDS